MTTMTRRRVTEKEGCTATDHQGGPYDDPEPEEQHVIMNEVMVKRMMTIMMEMTDDDDKEESN